MHLKREIEGKRMKRDGVGKNELLSLFFSHFSFLYICGDLYPFATSALIPKLPKLLPPYLPTS